MVTNNPEHRGLLESLTKHLPPVGSAAINKSAPKSKKTKAANSKAAAPVQSEDRNVRFDKIDKVNAGKLNREGYLASQSNAEAATERFDKWDSNENGFLSREEFLTMGKKQLQEALTRFWLPLSPEYRGAGG
ncbi:MAG: hypothetical protein NTW52_09825 [Planctomycetota bacterium]|nr:hypothetical protein [Planctomycetota bacterium]